MSSNINKTKLTGYSYFYLAVISILALGSTFALTNFDLDIFVKSSIFAFIVVVYLIGFSLFCIFQNNPIFLKQQVGTNDSPFNSEIEEKLLFLEEASEFFAATLKPADMFRLISGRVNEIIPFSACALFLCDEQKTHLTVNQVAGENFRQLKNLSILNSEGLAGKTFQTRQPQLDKNLFEDRKVFSRETLQNLTSAIAVPLVRGGEVFGILQLFAGKETLFDGNSLLVLEAVGERIIPLLTGSMAFELNLSSAMTDSLTNLPNERAFFLVLENQIAESLRFSEKRNLAVLLIDIKNFNELNKNYGHSTGDKILSFTAQTIRKELRQMDFLSRSVNDEFFAVLPTADQEETEKIIRRIEKTFLLDHFYISEQTKINVGLNFGFASFNTDGETANELLNIALLKKRQAKSFEDSNVLWFPKEFVN